MTPETVSKPSIFNSIESLSISPYPALVFGNILILKGALQSSASLAVNGSTGSTLIKSQKLQPTRISCFGFGATQLIGAWLMYDGEPVNAAGFNFAWLSLYLIVNGRSSFKSIFRGRVSPLGLSILALGNSVIYGGEFFWPRQDSQQPI